MEKKSLKEFRDLVLENKKVKIKPIFRTKAYFKKTSTGELHDGTHTYTGCNKGHGLPFSLENRSYVNPFLDEEKNYPIGTEQEAFEILLNQKEGSLNLYDFKVNKPNFWGEFSIKITKEGIDLNLNNPSDALRYRIFLVNPKFATDHDDAGIMEREYEIVDDKARKAQASKLGKKKSKAEDYMFKLKKSKKSMVDTLRLLGKIANRDSDIDWLREELYKIKDETVVTKGVAGIDKFLSVMEDPTREIKLFVLDALESQDIVRDKSGYKIVRSNTFVGRKYEEVVEYFKSKDPEVIESMQIISEQFK